MTELKIESAHFFGWHSTGQAKAKFGETEIEVKVDEATTAEILALIMRYVQDQQARMADEIRTAQPALLIDASVSEAEYNEV